LVVVSAFWLLGVICGGWGVVLFVLVVGWVFVVVVVGVAVFVVRFVLGWVIMALVYVCGFVLGVIMLVVVVFNSSCGVWVFTVFFSCGYGFDLRG